MIDVLAGGCDPYPLEEADEEARAFSFSAHDSGVTCRTGQAVNSIIAAWTVVLGERWMLVRRHTRSSMDGPAQRGNNRKLPGKIGLYFGPSLANSGPNLSDSGRNFWPLDRPAR